jgi:hypothetical protein
MYMDGSVSASSLQLIPSWNQLKVISQLAKRTTMQHAMRFTAGLLAWRRDVHKMQAWGWHSHPRWSTKERRLLKPLYPGKVLWIYLIRLPS